METNGHDPVGGIECFLYPITVMNVDIDIEDSLVVSQQLQDAQDDVCAESVRRSPLQKLEGLRLTVHIAEPTRFRLLRMMETASPVDRDVALVSRQPRCALCKLRGSRERSAFGSKSAEGGVASPRKTSTYPWNHPLK